MGFEAKVAERFARIEKALSALERLDHLEAKMSRVVGILEAQQCEIERLRRELHQRRYPATTGMKITPS